MAGKPEVKAGPSGLRCSPGLAVPLTPGPLPRHSQPYPWGPPPTHGPAGQAPGAGEQNSGSSAGPSAVSGMWGRGAAAGPEPGAGHAFLMASRPPWPPPRPGTTQPSPPTPPAQSLSPRPPLPASAPQPTNRNRQRWDSAPGLIPLWFFDFSSKKIEITISYRSGLMHVTANIVLYACLGHHSNFSSRAFCMVKKSSFL